MKKQKKSAGVKRARRPRYDDDCYSVPTGDAIARIYEKLDLHQEKAEKNRDEVKRDIDAVKNELSTAIKALGDRLDNKIDQQIAAFREQLGRLNTNMELVMSRLAEHDLRIKAIEDDRKIKAAAEKTADKFKALGLKFLNASFYAGVIIAAAYGVAPAKKLWNLFWQ